MSQIELTYPSVPGFKEKGDTSEAAARSIAEWAQSLRSRCLEVLRKRDMTSDELADAIGESILSVRPRVSELFARRLVFKTEMRRKNVSGRDAAVWSVAGEATPAISGEAAAQ